MSKIARRAIVVVAGGMLVVVAVLARSAEEKKTEPAERKHPFIDSVKVSFDEKHMVVQSDGIPNHPHGEFPNADNPNTIRKQDYKFYIPLEPKWSEKVTKTPFGPIGVAINGIPFYNQYNAQGRDAVKLEIFDSCCGHPDPMGRYHYHKYPVCIKSPFKDPEGEHSPLIGYAFDGYSIYGPNGENGKPPTDLDECNGHTDKERGYHYHVTAGYPYILGGYHGVVDQKNFDHGPPGGIAGPGVRGGPPGEPPRGRGRGGPPPDGPPPFGPPPFGASD